MIRVEDRLILHQMIARFATCLLASLLLFSAVRTSSAQTAGGVTLTAAAVTDTDGSGNPCSYTSPSCTSPQYWTTWGDQRLYLQTPAGAWINPGYGPGISIPLMPGDNTVLIYGNGGYGSPTFDALALYFNGHGGLGSTFYLCNGPADIMVFGPTGSGALNTGVSNSCLGTAGTKFVDGSTTVTLTAFNWAGTSSSFVSDTNNVPSGIDGFVGSFTLHVVSQPLTVTTTSVPGVSAGLAYNTTLAATGGSGTGYTWCVLAGASCDPSQASLPRGFSLSSAGLISALKGNSAPQGTYQFIVQVSDSGGDTSPPQQLTLGISCPMTVTLYPGSLAGDQYMQAQATFNDPNYGTLTNFAQSCGYLNFNWQQLITTLPCPSPFTQTSGAPPLPTQNYCQPLRTLTAPPAFLDPPPGGFSYDKVDVAPFSFSFADLTPGSCPWAGIACGSSPPSVFPYLVDVANTTLSFLDDPTDPLLPQGGFTAFQTTLVGISSSPSQGSVNCGPGAQNSVAGIPLYCTALFSWNWKSTFNGTAGGISQTTSIYPIDPGSGTGGVAVSSINGVPSPSISVDPSTSTINFGTPLSVAVTVAPFTGQPVPAGTVTLSSGTYTSAGTSLDGNGDATIIIPAGALHVGSDLLTAVFVPSAPVSASYSQAWGTAAVTVTPANQSITFGPIATQLIGETIPLTATATSGMPVSFQTMTSAVCSVSGNSSTMLSVGTCILQATQNGGTDYYPANPVQMTFPVTYGVCVLYNPDRAEETGEVVKLRLQLCDARKADVSSRSIVLQAINLVQTGTGASEPIRTPGRQDPDDDFRFEGWLGPTGGYVFDLETRGLTSGRYQLTFTAGADPVPHVLMFELRRRDDGRRDTSDFRRNL